MDLLTVLMHETGHLLGRDHEATGVMQETLTAGTRRDVNHASEANTTWLDIDFTGLNQDKRRVGGN